MCWSPRKTCQTPDEHGEAGEDTSKMRTNGISLDGHERASKHMGTTRVGKNLSKYKSPRAISMRPQIFHLVLFYLIDFMPSASRIRRKTCRLQTILEPPVLSHRTTPGYQRRTVLCKDRQRRYPEQSTDQSTNDNNRRWHAQDGNHVELKKEQWYSSHKRDASQTWEELLLRGEDRHRWRSTYMDKLYCSMIQLCPPGRYIQTRRTHLASLPGRILAKTTNTSPPK